MFCVAGVKYDESWRSAIGDEDKLNGIKAEQDKNTEIGARTWRLSNVPRMMFSILTD